MGEKAFFNRDELLALVKGAKSRIRVLGAVSFDLPYEDYRDDWYKRINEGKLHVEIICESEANLHYASLISANKKVSGQEQSYNIGDFMRMKNEPKIKLREYFTKKRCKHIEPKGENIDKDERQYFSLRTCYLHIPIPIINIDDEYYYTLSLTKFCTQDKFEKVTEESVRYKEFQQYFYAYFDSDLGAKKYSSEITAKDNRTEIILMYDDERQCLGQLPRQSFLDIPKAKVVVWGMVFTRDGRVLIHKRADNAKDNRGMWDKSIGGHVDVAKDTVDTVKAAAREMLEELYKIEAKDQGDHDKREIKEINFDFPMFSGEWKEESRATLPFEEIKTNSNAISFFRMNYNFSKKAIDSPRIMPDNSKSSVKCLVDMYVFIMDERFDEKELENSSFKLLKLNELQDVYGGELIKYIDKDTKEIVTERFIPTPDLEKIITTESLWAELTVFSGYLKKGLGN